MSPTRPPPWRGRWTGSAWTTSPCRSASPTARAASCRCPPASTWPWTWPAPMRVASTCRVCTCSCRTAWRARPSPRPGCATCCRTASPPRPGCRPGHGCAYATTRCCSGARWPAAIPAGSAIRCRSRHCWSMATCNWRCRSRWNTPAPVRPRRHCRGRPTPNASPRISPPRRHRRPARSATGWRPSAAWPPPRMPSAAAPMCACSCARNSTSCRWWPWSMRSRRPWARRCRRRSSARTSRRSRD